MCHHAYLISYHFGLVLAIAGKLAQERRLAPETRTELYVLMRIGQGDFAAKKWRRGLAEATNLGDETITGAILEDADLHDHVMQELYEAELIS